MALNNRQRGVAAQGAATAAIASFMSCKKIVGESCWIDDGAGNVKTELLQAKVRRVRSLYVVLTVDLAVMR